MDEKTLPIGIKNQTKKALLFIFVLLAVLIVLFFASFLVGTRYYGFVESFQGLFGNGDSILVRVMQKVRLPRTLGAVIVGGCLALSGLMMQSCLKNPMASPSTMGISNAATLGANIAILFLAGGGASGFALVAANPYAVSGFALLFALICTGLVLFISSFKKFSPTSVVLVGIAMGSFFQALVTLIQFFADDVQLSSIINWTFGDLERITMEENLICAVVLIICFGVFFALSFRFNALSAGEGFARSVGVHTNLLRLVGLFLASLLCAICVSFVGIIGFLGIIAPHICKRIIGSDHRFTIPASILLGAVLLLAFDIITRLIGNGISLPVGAITAIVGAPFFIALLFFKKEAKQ